MISEISAKITIVGATNHPGSLDRAVQSLVRYDIQIVHCSKFIKVPLPDDKTRIKFIIKKLEDADFHNGLGEDDLKKVAKESQKFSFRDLQRLW